MVLLFLQDMISYKSCDAIGCNTQAERELTSSVAWQKLEKANEELAPGVNYPAREDEAKEGSFKEIGSGSRSD